MIQRTLNCPEVWNGVWMVVYLRGSAWRYSRVQILRLLPKKWAVIRSSWPMTPTRTSTIENGWLDNNITALLMGSSSYHIHSSTVSFSNAVHINAFITVSHIGGVVGADNFDLGSAFLFSENKDECIGDCVQFRWLTRDCVDVECFQTFQKIPSAQTLCLFIHVWICVFIYCHEL